MRICNQKWTPPLSIAAVIPIAMLALSAGCSGRQEADPATTTSVDEPPRVEQALPQALPAEGKGSVAQPVTTREHDANDKVEESIMVTARKMQRSDMAALSMHAATIEPGRICCPGDIRHPSEPLDRENYEHFDENPVKLVSEHPVSTFSIDVDTGSYSNVRRFLNAGSLPPEDAVRVEELINYFSYDYPVPDRLDNPFSVSTDVSPAPWNADKLLLQVGIKGYELSDAERKPANLVFLVDVSGSMNSNDKLPLLKNALKMLTRQMTAEDRVSMVVYAGASG
ncbi:MAG: VWA domain-containing protein, partial [Gammaproteobacteria bacterium]